MLVFLLSLPLGAQTLFTGLMGRWTFDEGGGTTVTDLSGQGNHGTLINGAGSWTTGQYGGALYFPGTVGAGSTRVEIPNTPTLQAAITTGATFSAWVRVDDINRDAPILAKEGPSGLNFWFGAFGLGGESSGPGNFGMLLDNGGGQPWAVLDRNQGALPQGTWVHLASTWDGTQITHYVNGVVVAGGALFTGPASTTPDILAIGANAGYLAQANATAFMGAVDELYLFNRALAPAEIGQLMSISAIPEPGVTSLLVLGTAALGFVTLRRRRAGS